jgi:hypothetical protein
VVFGWGLAQYPYLSPPTLALAPDSAPTASLTTEFIVAGLAVGLVVPGFAILYFLQQRHLLTAHESDTELRLAAQLEPAIPGQPAAVARAPAATGLTKLVLTVVTIRAIRNVFSSRHPR